MTNERIEAEIAAEIKRIEAWNDPELAHVVGSWLRPSAIRSLANHLCQSRLQVEDARVAALVEALRLCLPLIQWHQQPYAVTQQVQSAIAPFEVTP